MNNMHKILPACGAAVASAAMIVSFTIPSQAVVRDIAVEEHLANPTAASQTDIPENPAQKLPKQIAQNIPDDATVVSEDLASDDEGRIYDVETGEQITDPRLVGTDEKPADPLAKTDGESFIPVEVEEVKEKIDEQDSPAAGVTKQSKLTSAKNYAQARMTALPNNGYGAHWGTYNGTPAFFQNNGQLFVQQAKGVIDVSQWQGNIDWNAVKASGNVQGVIVRLGYGWGNSLDTKAARNISELKRLGIPFGVYWYSYSSSAANSQQEANSTVAALRQLGVSPNDLSYPVYYDMERWSWTGHAPSTDPNVNAAEANTYINALVASGYKNTSIYSYTSYLNSALRHNDIWSKTSWVAQYGASMGFTAWNTNFRGWQYSSQGAVSGISGNVDVNAFGNAQYAADFDMSSYPLVTVPNGNYYINPKLSEKISLDISGASRDNGVQIQVYAYNNSAAQQFKFTRNSDGSYTIANVNSGKVLDVSGANASNYARVQQYDSNGSTAQRWFIRDTGTGYAIQSALGNWVLDLNGASTANGNAIQLYTPNNSDAQKFFLASVVGPATNQVVKISSALASSRVIDIDSASTSNSAAAQLWEWNASAAQLFTLQQVGNGTYTITNNNSHKVLDVVSNGTVNGTPVDQYDSNGTAAQQWVIRKNTDGTYSMQGRGSGKFIELPGANTASGTRLSIYSGNNTSAQKWNIKVVTTQDIQRGSFVNAHKNDLANGTFEFLRPNKKTVALDLSGASHANGGNVQIYSLNHSNAQHWVVSHDSLGYATLTNKESGKVLDVNSAIVANGQNVQQYDSNGSDAQKWVAVKNANGTYTFYSKLNTDYALDVESNGTANSTNVRLYKANGTVGQQWLMNTTSSFAHMHQYDLEPDTYILARPQDSQVVMDLAGADTWNGANINVYKANGTSAQKWSIRKVSPGYVAIFSVATGKVLDVSGALKSNGTNVQQWIWNGTQAQMWIPVLNANGTYTFYSALDRNYALDVSSDSTANGSNVQLWAANGTNGQQWKVLK